MACSSYQEGMWVYMYVMGSVSGVASEHVFGGGCHYRCSLLY